MADDAILREESAARLDHFRFVEAGRNVNPAEARIDGVIGSGVDGPAYDCIVRRGRGHVIDSRIDEADGAGNANDDTSKDGQKDFQVTLRPVNRHSPNDQASSHERSEKLTMTTSAARRHGKGQSVDDGRYGIYP